MLRDLIRSRRRCGCCGCSTSRSAAEEPHCCADAGVRLGRCCGPQGFSLAPTDRQFEIDYGDGTLSATPVDTAIAEALAPTPA